MKQTYMDDARNRTSTEHQQNINRTLIEHRAILKRSLLGIYLTLATLLLSPILGIGQVWAQTTLSSIESYSTYSTSNVKASDLTSLFPDYITTTISNAMNGNGVTSTVTSPIDFKSLSSSTKYYRLKTGKDNITITKLANVSSVHLYGNGSGGARNVTATVQTTDNTTLGTLSKSFSNKNTEIIDYEFDISSLTGYSSSAYYTITFAFGGDCSIFGLALFPFASGGESGGGEGGGETIDPPATGGGDCDDPTIIGQITSEFNSKEAEEDMTAEGGKSAGITINYTSKTQDNGKLGSNGHYFTMKVSNGWKAGDQISVTSDKKSIIFTEGTNADFGEEHTITSETTTVTITLTADQASACNAKDNSLSIRRVEKEQNPTMSNITIKRCLCDDVTITTQPVSAKYEVEATDVKDLSVAAEGGTIESYQWYSNTSASNEGGTAIEGATEATYKPTLGAVDTQAYYYCVVTNDCGNFATSNVATIKVKPIPLALVISTESAELNIDGTLNLAATGNQGGDIAWTWDYKGDGLTLADGVITAKHAGEYTFNVTASVEKQGNYAAGLVTKPITITVNCKNAVPILTYPKTSLLVGAKGTASLDADGQLGTVTYSSSDAAIVSVDASMGDIIAKAAGTATITATFEANGDFCEVTTAGVAITVTTPISKYYYVGTKENNWGTFKPLTVSIDGYYEYYASTADAPNTNNVFKITDASAWGQGEWGNAQHWPGFNGTNMTSMNSSSSNWGETGGNSAMWCGGAYYIIVYYPNTAANKTANPVICASTALPSSLDLAGGQTIYFDNNTENTDPRWTDTDVHLRLGNMTYNEKVTFAKVPGTKNLLKVTVPAINGLSAYHVANNDGWTGTNSIYKTNTGDDYAITVATNFSKEPISNDFTIQINADGSTGNDEQNNNCTFYPYTQIEGMLKHTVTIAEGAALTISYTDENNVEQSFSSGSRDLAHTVMLRISANEIPEGHQVKYILADGVSASDYKEFTKENPYVLAKATTFSVEFEEKTQDMPAGAILYFNNYWSGVEADQWDNIYFRIGRRDHNTVAKMEQVPGTYLWKVTVPKYDKFLAWHISENYGDDTRETSIFATQATDMEHPITRALEFSKIVLSAEQVLTMCPTTTHNTGESEDNNNCEFYTHTEHAGLLKHKAQANATGPGTFKVTYTDAEGNLQELTEETALPHTTILTLSATPESAAYRCKVLVNGEEYTGTTLVLTEDVTIGAVFEPATESEERCENVSIINKTISGTSGSNTNGFSWTLQSDGKLGKDCYVEYTYDAGFQEGDKLRIKLKRGGTGAGDILTLYVAVGGHNTNNVLPENYTCVTAAVDETAEEQYVEVTLSSDFAGQKTLTIPRLNWTVEEQAYYHNHCILAIEYLRKTCTDITIVPVAKEEDWLDTYTHETYIKVIGNVTVGEVTPNKAVQAAEVTIVEGGKLTIKPTGSVLVNGAIKGATVDNLIIESNETNQGALIHFTEGEVAATVNFYSPASGAPTNAVYQYVGVPMESANAIDHYKYAYLLEWNEKAGQWVNVPNDGTVTAFKGYAYSQTAAGNRTIKTTLASSTNRTLTLTCTPESGLTGTDLGNNLLANSWMAPIRLSKFKTDDFNGVDGTFYIFNSGTYEEWNNAVKKEGSEAGQYTVVPAKQGKSLGYQEIAPLQGFFMIANTNGATVNLDYDRLVMPEVTDSIYGAIGTGPRRAPQAEEQTDDMIRLRVVGADETADNLTIFVNENYTLGFDNMYEGAKMDAGAHLPYLAAQTSHGNMAVLATPEAEGTMLRFRKGNATNSYTFYFDYAGEEQYYLYDSLTGTYTLIVSGNTYSFASDENVDETRFSIMRKPNGGNIVTSLDGAYMQNGMLYLNSDGVMAVRVFTPDGKCIWSMQEVRGNVALQELVQQGVYLVEIQSATDTRTIKCIL